MQIVSANWQFAVPLYHVMAAEEQMVFLGTFLLTFHRPFKKKICAPFIKLHCPDTVAKVSLVEILCENQRNKSDAPTQE